MAAMATALVVVGGCSALRGGPEAGPVAVCGFAVKGKLAVRLPDDGFSSSFLWQHAPDRDEIELWGPLGQGRSRMVGDPEAVVVYTAKGEVYRERSPEAGMQRWLGFSIPLPALTHWLRGEAAPGYPVSTNITDPEGRLLVLEQLSWRLEYSRYDAAAGGEHLPGRIVATRDDIKVTLLPAEWSFSPQTADLTPCRPIIRIPPFRKSGLQPAQPEISVESSIWGVAKR
jgi:outer membrane lipoprotein LolB